MHTCPRLSGQAGFPYARLLCVSATALLFLTVSPAPLHAQGSLTPPGAPSPTMKSLDQVEPRKIVNPASTPGDAANTCIISASGSYYLAANFAGESGKHGISIQADDVTLDLNGFALISGGGASARGINVPTAKSNICIRNGSVRGWSGGGVRGDAATGLAEKLLLTNNTGGIGLAMGNGSIIRDCEASGNGTGFFAPDRTMISHCISTVNTGIGISTTDYVSVTDCTVSRNGGVGIQLGGSDTVMRCSVTRNDGGGIAGNDGLNIADCEVANNPGNGIAVGAGSTVRKCTVHTSGQKGILASDRCHLIENTCEGNLTGIEVTGTDNRVDGNHSATTGGTGPIAFHIGGSQNVVVRNTAHAPLHQISPGVFIVDGAYVFDNSNNNSYGPILSSAGGQISSNSPWANYQNF